MLASASPRRRELLAQAGVPFEIEVSNVDEEIDSGTDPHQAAVLLAERKARAIARLHEGQGIRVLGADTVVCVDGEDGSELLGKPGDRTEARRMLATLSGSRHRVVTGVAVIRCSDGVCWSGDECTWVTMRPLSPAEVDAYVATGEWVDKAGGYAIQESADAFVTSLEEGGFDNVVGLPVGLALDLLDRADQE